MTETERDVRNLREILRQANARDGENLTRIADLERDLFAARQAVLTEGVARDQAERDLAAARRERDEWRDRLSALLSHSCAELDALRSKLAAAEALAAKEAGVYRASVEACIAAEAEAGRLHDFAELARDCPATALHLMPLAASAALAAERPSPMDCECLGWERQTIYDSDTLHHPKCPHAEPPAFTSDGESITCHKAGTYIVLGIKRPEPPEETCLECGGSGQSDVCHCGLMMDASVFNHEHQPVPMPCPRCTKPEDPDRDA